MKEYLKQKVNYALSKMGAENLDFIFERPKEESTGRY
jgi:hypothetical protein